MFIGANCISSTDIPTMVVEPKIKGCLNYSDILFTTLGRVYEVCYVGIFAVHLVVHILYDFPVTWLLNWLVSYLCIISPLSPAHHEISPAKVSNSNR